MVAFHGAREAQIAVRNMLDPRGNHTIDHRFSPMAVFIDPEFVKVGLTHAQAEAQGWIKIKNQDIDRTTMAKPKMNCWQYKKCGREPGCSMADMEGKIVIISKNLVIIPCCLQLPTGWEGRRRGISPPKY